MTDERSGKLTSVGYRRIARTTDVRTIISGLLPKVGFGDNTFLIRFWGGP